MAIDLKRREAFQYAFKNYPDYLRVFSENHCNLVNPRTGERPLMTSVEFPNIQKLLMAQFATRLVRTRLKDGPPAALDFGFTTGQRYHDYRKTIMGGLDVEADAAYQRALNAIEQNMAGTIMTALAAEANMTQEFEEVDFWRDVFLSFVSNQKNGDPKWVLPLQAVILSHMPEFKLALAA